MASATIYCSKECYFSFQDVTYSDIQAGTAGVESLYENTASFVACGQNHFGPGGLEVMGVIQMYYEFDTSSIPDNATITSVAFSVKLSADNAIDVSTTLECRAYDAGASVTTADWVNGSSVSGLTLLASKTWAVGTTGTGYQSFTEYGSNFQSNINKSGTTKFIVIPERYGSNIAPVYGTEEIVSWYGMAFGSDDAKLDITYITAQSIAGTITMSGTLSRHITKSFSGSTGNLTGALTVGAAYFKELAGSVGNLTGSLVRTTNKALSGTFTGTGSLTKFITKSFSGTTGTLEATMNATKTKLVSLTGTMGTLSGVVTSVQTGFGVALSGSISSISGSIGRTTNKALSGAITPTGRVTLLGTFRSAIMKAGTIIRRTIRGGSG